jgi:hypothetical protein
LDPLLTDEEPKLYKLSFKIYRDLARLAFLCKDKSEEAVNEDISKEMYCEFLNQLGIKKR